MVGVIFCTKDISYNIVDTTRGYVIIVITEYLQIGEYMRTQVRKIGNSLGSIIPATFIRQLGLVEGAEIDVKTEGKKIIIEPVSRLKKRFPFSETQLLEGLDAYTGHTDELPVLFSRELGE